METEGLAKRMPFYFTFIELYTRCLLISYANNKFPGKTKPKPLYISNLLFRRLCSNRFFIANNTYTNNYLKVFDNYATNVMVDGKAINLELWGT